MTLSGLTVQLITPLMIFTGFISTAHSTHLSQYDTFIENLYKYFNTWKGEDVWNDFDRKLIDKHTTKSSNLKGWIARYEPAQDKPENTVTIMTYTTKIEFRRFSSLSVEISRFHCITPDLIASHFGKAFKTPTILIDTFSNSGNSISAPVEYYYTKSNSTDKSSALFSHDSQSKCLTNITFSFEAYHANPQ